MDTIDTLIESYRDDMVAALQELVRIPSVRGDPLAPAPLLACTKRWRWRRTSV